MVDFSHASDTPPAVLLVGSPHLANHNHDMFNVQFDDMLSPRRQQEIASCIEQLKRFQPTKVAVEVLTEKASDLNQDYQHYRAGTFALTASEVYQLGFRVAEAAGHEQIYAIDWNGEMGWEQAFDFAQKHQPALFNELLASGQQEMREANAQVEQLHVREILRGANDPTKLAEDHRAYLTMMRFGEGQNYVGIEAVKNWYARNMRIFVNLTRIITSPDDCVLVVYGSGHIPLLSQFIHDSGLYTLEETLTYLQ